MKREWWFDEFELPVLSTVGLDKHDMANSLEGDARVVGPQLQTGKRALPAAGPSGYSVTPPLPFDGPRPKKPKAQVHNVCATSGQYLTNRSGKK